MEPIKVKAVKINIFNARELWSNPEYSISKLCDGFEMQNFPITCFLEWTLPTDEQLAEMSAWIQDEARYLRETVLLSTQDENGNNTMAPGEIIFIYLKGTQS